MIWVGYVLLALLGVAALAYVALFAFFYYAVGAGDRRERHDASIS